MFTSCGRRFKWILPFFEHGWTCLKPSQAIPPDAIKLGGDMACDNEHGETIVTETQKDIYEYIFRWKISMFGAISTGSTSSDLPVPPMLAFECNHTISSQTSDLQLLGTAAGVPTLHCHPNSPKKSLGGYEQENEHKLHLEANHLALSCEQQTVSTERWITSNQRCNLKHAPSQATRRSTPIAAQDIQPSLSEKSLSSQVEKPTSDIQLINVDDGVGGKVVITLIKKRGSMGNKCGEISEILTVGRFGDSLDAGALVVMRSSCRLHRDFATKEASVSMQSGSRYDSDISRERRAGTMNVPRYPGIGTLLLSVKDRKDGSVMLGTSSVPSAPAGPSSQRTRFGRCLIKKTFVAEASSSESSSSCNSRLRRRGIEPLIAGRRDSESWHFRRNRGKAGRKLWATGVDRQEVDKDLGGDFIGQGQNRIFVAVEPLQH
ncbi:hypothetical protein DFH08DRAFT_802487 [Mycena albidolilacea]|uniref:Uncharacterized protein n=1 Tax=Mycena albidolilacea TaxID=1033008 RepID=A0AAD7ADZ8_9AGAR|nr:hypothetical protein DFH08DRAFT_802487 [Mycena albidolilacea]